MGTQWLDYRGYRFPAQIISYGVWLYYRFSLSFRDIEDLLAQHGVEVSYESIRQWCEKFGCEYAATARRKQVSLPKTSSADLRRLSDRTRDAARRPRVDKRRRQTRR